MLIEDLIRLGKPLLDGDMRAEELLPLITDVADSRAKNFYRNVFVVVLEEGAQPQVLARQVYGSEDEDGDFVVNAAKALGIAITLPSGGNPINAQGRYGLPVYPLYDRHVQEFCESAKHVSDFLDSRIERTPGLVLDDSKLQSIAQMVHEQAKVTALHPKKNLGVLVLADCSEKGLFRFNNKKLPSAIGELPDGRAIVPNHEKIVEAILAAKVEEGRKAGERPGPAASPAKARFRFRPTAKPGPGLSRPGPAPCPMVAMKPKWPKESAFRRIVIAR